VPPAAPGGGGRGGGAPGGGRGGRGGGGAGGAAAAGGGAGAAGAGAGAGAAGAAGAEGAATETPAQGAGAGGFGGANAPVDNDNLVAKAGNVKSQMMAFSEVPSETLMKQYTDVKTALPKAIADANGVLVKAMTVSQALKKYDVSLTVPAPVK
jgi:hypothetical protein